MLVMIVTKQNEEKEKKLYNSKSMFHSRKIFEKVASLEARI